MSYEANVQALTCCDIYSQPGDVSMWEQSSMALVRGVALVTEAVLVSHAIADMLS